MTAPEGSVPAMPLYFARIASAKARERPAAKAVTPDAVVGMEPHSVMHFRVSVFIQTPRFTWTSEVQPP
jgi:hypothetical protein